MPVTLRPPVFPLCCLHTMAPSTISLLKAILQTDDSPHVPDSWRSSLLRDYMDSQSRGAVAQSCTSGLQCLLGEWPNPALKVPVRASSAERQPRALVRRMQGARRQINSVRPGRPVALVLTQQGDIAASDKWWQAVLGGLSDPCPPAQHLHISLRFRHIFPTLLSVADQIFTGLHTLTLDSHKRGVGCEVQLPPTHELPALRHLTVGFVARDCQATMWASLRPYLPQLVSLVIKDQPDDAVIGDNSSDEDVDEAPHGTHRKPSWSLAFGPTVSHTLTRLEVPCNLYPWLVTLLHRCTPVSYAHMAARTGNTAPLGACHNAPDIHPRTLANRAACACVCACVCRR